MNLLFSLPLFCHVLSPSIFGLSPQIRNLRVELCHRGPEQRGDFVGMILRVQVYRSQDDGYGSGFHPLALSNTASMKAGIPCFASKDVDIFSRFCCLEWWDDSFEGFTIYQKHGNAAPNVSRLSYINTRAFTNEDSFRMNQLLLK